MADLLCGSPVGEQLILLFKRRERRNELKRRKAVGDIMCIAVALQSATVKPDGGKQVDPKRGAQKFAVYGGGISYRAYDVSHKRPSATLFSFLNFQHEPIPHEQNPTRLYSEDATSAARKLGHFIIRTDFTVQILLASALPPCASHTKDGGPAKLLE